MRLSSIAASPKRQPSSRWRASTCSASDAVILPSSIRMAPIWRPGCPLAREALSIGSTLSVGLTSMAILDYQGWRRARATLAPTHRLLEAWTKVGEPGHDTWAGDAWKNGGGSVWVTGSYDPELNLTYWGIGNPGPDWNPDQRPGDNLYTDSVIALDSDTGALKWHFQFTPNDAYDYDSVQVPVLVDMNWQGKPAKVMLWANRNGHSYVLDRVTGKFLRGTPFVKVNWASGLDANGRPIQTPQPPGAPTYPGNQGGTNWYPPSFSPRTGLFYFSAWENYATIYRKEESVYQPGRNFSGGGFTVLTPVPGAPAIGIGRRTPINIWTNEVGNGAVIALDPTTGQAKWKFAHFDVTDAGILTTASDLLFTGGREGYFHALDARTGKLLWRASLGGQVVMAPITYQVAGKQYVSVISGHTLVTFALRN